VSDHAAEMWYGDKKIAKEMTKEQLENKFEFGLEYLNIGSSILTGNSFKHKDLAKRKDPQWPIVMNLFTMPSLRILNLSVCNMTKNDVELLAYCLHENPVGKSHVRVLNLSRNKILKEGVKILAPALEGNKSVEVVDLS